MLLRRTVVAIALLAAGGCAPVTPQAMPGGPVLLAIVTWNMNAGRGDLPRLLDDLASGRLTGGPPREFIVLLQEAIEGRERDVRTVGALRRLSSFYSAVRTGPAGITGNAILSTLPLAGPQAIDLPRARQARAAIAAGIRVAGERFFVVSAHLENRVGWLDGLFGDNARAQQADALLRALPPRGYGVLGGDMNTMLGPAEPAWRAFLLRFPDTPERPAPTFRDRLVLDHLFFDIPDGWAVTRRVLPDRYGSDHHPVLGVVGARGR